MLKRRQATSHHVEKVPNGFRVTLPGLFCVRVVFWQPRVMAGMR